MALRVNPLAEGVGWSTFCATHAPYALALDGYVRTGTRFDPSGPRLALGHPETAARVTCAQAVVAVRQGLYDCFRDTEGPRAEVFVNDCDEDVCTAWFALARPGYAAPGRHPGLDRLVDLVETLHTTAGVAPIPTDLTPLKELAWVFAPYQCARRDGGLDRRDRGLFEGVVDEVASRIGSLLDGRGGSHPLDGRYRRLGGGRGWALIREVGTHARLGAVADGVRAYVAARERPDGRWSYAIARTSPFVPFDVPRVAAAIDGAEGGNWSGGGLTGGCSPVRGSGLHPDEVQRVVNAALLGERAGDVPTAKNGRRAACVTRN